MYTGVGSGNIENVRVYKEVYGSPYVRMNYSWFNGSDVINTLASPWEGDVALSGTDGVINQPFEKSDGSSQLGTFIYTSFCGPTMISNDTEQAKEKFYGLETQIYTPTPTFWVNYTNYSPNKKFFQNKYNGYLNLTNAQRAPVFISQTHFYEAQDLTDSVVFLGKDGNEITANVYDGNF
jgi:hypothetical protein